MAAGNHTPLLHKLESFYIKFQNLGDRLLRKSYLTAHLPFVFPFEFKTRHSRFLGFRFKRINFKVKSHISWLSW